MKKNNFIVLATLLSLVPCHHIWADSSLPDSHKWATKLRENRENRLDKIYKSLFDEKKDLSLLGLEITDLIKDYKVHLHKIEATNKEVNLDKALFREINLILGQLEKGKERILSDQGQAVYCFELITAIESIFEKLENPEVDYMDVELPMQSLAIETSYKRLKGEQLPYYLKVNPSQIKKVEENIDLPPPSLAYVKLSSLLPEGEDVPSSITSYSK